MADDAVARLDFATNIATVTAEVTRSLQQLQTQLESAGSRAGTKGQIGQQFTEGLQKIIGNVTEMGNTIQQQVTRSIEGLAKLSDFKGPTTLGGQFSGLITQLQEASAAYAKALDPTASRQLGGQANVQAQTRQQLVAPIQALINQLREVQQIVNQRIAAMGVEQRAAFERFANPAQVGRAVGIGVAAGAVDSGGTAGGGIVAATDATIKARQREATAAAAAAQADEEYAQELRNLKVYLDEEIAAGRARRFANDNVNVDTQAGRVQYRYPSQLPYGEVPAGAGTEEDAHLADVRRAEEAAYQAQERFLAQQEKDSLTLTRQQQGVNRAQQQAIDTEAKWADQALQAARFAAYQSGTEGYARLGAKSPYFATPEGPAKLTGAGLDTGLNTKELDAAFAAYAKSGIRGGAAMEQAASSFQQVKVANEGLARSDELYSSLIAKEGLGGLAEKNPGNRVLSGYAQLGQTLYRQNGSSLEVIQGQEQVYRSLRALADALAKETRLAQGGTSGGAAVDPRRGSVFDSFLGGAFGHGFDTSQSFDPKLALGNLAATAGVLARYGYEFKLIQGALGSIKTAFQDLGTYQAQMVSLDEAIAATGADSLDLGSSFATATTDALNQNDAISIGTQALQAYRNELGTGTSANTIFSRSISAVGDAMILTGQDAATVQKNLIAATNSFQLGSAGQSRINDAVVAATRNYGGNRSEIYDALATAGGAAQEAGLSPEQLANIIALIRSRTGDSGSTIASSINRLVSRQDNAQFRGALTALGVQQTGQVGPEIQALSVAYNKLTTAEQQHLIIQLGGARALKDLLPLLQSGTSLVDANKRSEADAGAAAAEAARQLDTLSGQLKVLRALLTDILTNLGRAGIFTALGGGLALLKPALVAVNELLSTFDSFMPGIGKSVLGVTLDILALGKAIEVFSAKMAVSRAASVVAADATVAQQGVLVAYDETLAKDVAIRTAATEAALRHAEVTNLESGAIEAQLPLLVERNALLAEGVFAGGIGEIGPVVATGGKAGLLSAGALGGNALLGLLTNPIALAIGGFVAIGAVTSHVQALNKAMDDGTAALRDLANAKTPSDYQTAAGNLKAASAAQHKAGRGVWAWLSGDESPDTSGIDAQASYAAATAKNLEADASNTSSLVASAFGPTGHDVVSGLQEMKSQGLDAGLQLKAVAQALGLVHSAAGSLAGRLTAGPGPTGLRLSDALIATVVSGTSTPSALGSQKAFNATLGKGLGSAEYTTPGPTVIQQKINDAVSGLGTGDLLTDADKTRIAEAVADSYGLSGSKDEITRTRAAIRASVLAILKSQTLKAISLQTGPINDQDLAAILPDLSALAPKGDPTKLGSLASQLGGGPASYLAVLKGVAARADKQGANYPGLIALIADAENNYVTARVADLERLRAAAEAHAGTNTGLISSIRKDYFAREIASAGTDETALVSIFNQMTQSEIDLFRAKYQQEVELAKAALASEEALLTAVDSLPNANDVATEKLAQVQSRGVIAAQNKYKTALDLLNSFKTAGKSAVPQTGPDNAQQTAQATELARINAQADPRNPVQQAQVALEAARYQLHTATTQAERYNALKAVKDAEYALAQAHVNLANAVAQGQVFPGSQIEAAAAELKVATGELKLAEKGTVDWYKAEGDMLKARLDYAAAVQENAHVLRELHGDTTDPVFQAQEALRQAKDHLRSDQANNAPSDVINADRLKVKEASDAKQRAAFDQKFQDEKTAFDLQQISATAYIAFLDHQRNALQAIHHKTRQQIDELNQIDQAIKAEAGTLDGQFNIGTIKIPTPYEARRYIQATSQGQGYQSTAVTNTTNNLTISGADTQKIKAILKQLLGPPSIGRTSTGTRKT